MVVRHPQLELVEPSSTSPVTVALSVLAAESVAGQARRPATTAARPPARRAAAGRPVSCADDVGNTTVWSNPADTVGGTLGAVPPAGFRRRRFQSEAPVLLREVEVKRVRTPTGIRHCSHLSVSSGGSVQAPGVPVLK